MRLSMLMIFVPDLEEARAFYGDLLGFPLREAGADRLIFGHDGGDLVAFRCDRPAGAGGYAREARAVFVFEVPSIEAAMQAWRARGVRFLHAEPARNDLGRYAAFVDPFGIVHEIFEPTHRPTQHATHDPHPVHAP